MRIEPIAGWRRRLLTEPVRKRVQRLRGGKLNKQRFGEGTGGADGINRQRNRVHSPYGLLQNRAGVLMIRVLAGIQRDMRRKDWRVIALGQPGNDSLKDETILFCRQEPE